MTDRRRFLSVFFVLIAFSLMNFLRLIGRPGLSNVRTVDLVQLVGAGMCLGGAIVALVFAFKAPRT